MDFTALGRLDGRAYLVLGAGQGIGEQTARALSGHGADVVCVDVEADRAQEVAAEVGGHPVVADITSPHGIEVAFEGLDAVPGSFGGLVDVVGIAFWDALRDIDEQNWNRSMSLNLEQAFLAMQRAARVPTPHTASLVFVASVSGLWSAPMHAAYGAAKAGLMSLVRTAAVELGPGIRVNAVAPGKTLTPRIRAKADTSAELLATRRTPLLKLGQPSDIAAASYFLASDLSGHITGQTLVVDGGIGCRFPYSDD